MNRERRQRSERDVEDLLRLYLHELARFPALAKDDEIRLAQAIDRGNAARTELAEPDEITPERKAELHRAIRRGDDAKATLIQSNLQLVIAIARRFRKSGVPILDLIQEGNIGLMHAVDKFDWRKDFRFTTYASWWVRAAISRSIANTGRIIRLPVHIGASLTLLQGARARLEITLGRRATVLELAAEVEMSEEKAREALRFEQPPISLEERIGDDFETELGDLLADDDASSPLDAATDSLLASDVARLLNSLDERERRVVALRFGLDRHEPRSLREVGEHVGVTRECVRQIEVRAMEKLRHPAFERTVRMLLDA